MDSKSEKDGVESIDLARRKLLGQAGWVPPAIIAAVSVNTNHALAVFSCGPGSSDCCGPDEMMGLCTSACMPDCDDIYGMGAPECCAPEF